VDELIDDVDDRADESVEELLYREKSDNDVEADMGEKLDTVESILIRPIELFWEFTGDSG